MKPRVSLLINEIKRLNKALYRNRKELDEIQENCEHCFPKREFEEKKKTRKVFVVVCSKCGYDKMVSEYAVIR
mgnify:CR=1 FL=1